MPMKLSPRLLEQSREAPFIFAGRVRALGENNLRGIQPIATHALVEVEEVIVAPATLGDLRGRVATVVLARPAKKGGRYTWWATSWIFGRELGVIEIARADGIAAKEVADTIIDARLRAFDERILARITGAEIVVAGTVDSVEELGVDGIAEGTTWRRAAVRVATVVKGEGAAEVIIQFPGAGSPRWAYAPRLVVGQEGIWLLRRPSQDPRMRSVKADGAWVGLDPEDAHASSGLARIEALARFAELRTRQTRR
jgi:hypothetical protein